MTQDDYNCLVATVDHLGFHTDVLPAERVRHVQRLWQQVRGILRRASAEYLREEPDTVVARFSDRPSATLAAQEIRHELQASALPNSTPGINISLDNTSDIDTLLSKRRPGTLRLNFSRRNWNVSIANQLVTIGRGLHNDICLTDETSSLEHTRIEFRDGRHVLVDCSHNGTIIKDAAGERLIVGGEVRLPRAGIICCSRVHFGCDYSESILFGPPEIESE